MRFLPVNLDAVLVELDDLSQTLALLASLQAEPIAGVHDIVPAARTLLVSFRPAAISRAELIERIGVRSVDARAEEAGERIEIPVTYNGEDLEDVARLLDISPQEVVRRHLPPGPLRILDVGGGTGIHAEWLAADGHVVHVVDHIPVSTWHRPLTDALAAKGRPSPGNGVYEFDPITGGYRAG